MKIHEFQAKQVLARHGVPIPRGRVAATPDECAAVAAELGGGLCVVKAQVHVGGRGKAGGVKLAKTPDEARQMGAQILGMDIKGLTVHKVLVEEGIAIDKEIYLGMILDRDSKRIVVMVSAEGGMDIEEVAEHSPEKIARCTINPALGLTDYQVRHLCFGAGLPKDKVKEIAVFLKALYQAITQSDATLAEINPLVITKDGTLIAADAKMDIDENALYRQKELALLQESEENDPIEEEARRRGLTYVHLDGDIGIIGNGAGLVMTSLDVVAREGGKAANFLDIGGGAKAEVVRNALEVVLLEPKVKGVVINIFGGITRCDEVAKGVIDAAGKLDIKVPVVVRLEGTSVEEGKKLLAESGLNLVPAGSMREAAAKVVELAYAGGR
ncbi:MAG: ADP-forming succinate--CoA ligase subunit beta [Candidatus Sericytochromatia bacterium]|nr:ADP-forming succinate--CoA ligase subunit beta [Candidatus Tanganyikabacteria bacterium]